MIGRVKKNLVWTVTNFTWEDYNLAQGLNENRQPIRRYVYGLGKDEAEGYVELSEVTGGMFDQSRQGWPSYIKDQVGTVYKVYSDYAKHIVDTRTYDTFGNLISQTGSSDGNLGFQSKYFDQESGMYYFYHRYYQPANGRFLNEDPIRFNGSLNFYAVFKNNSINYIDEYGLKITSIVVCHKERRVKMFSDSGKVYDLPAAFGQKCCPIPPPGTTYYIRGMYKNPTNPKWRETKTPWDSEKNTDNPYGPYIIMLVSKKGRNIHKHIHGTRGGWGSRGDTNNLGGDNPLNRHITHGCVRIPNADIKDIWIEGVLKGGKVEYVYSCSK